MTNAPGSRSPLLLTLPVHEQLCAARANAPQTIRCSLDLGRSEVSVDVEAEQWKYADQAFPFLDVCKDRTIYFWTGEAFAPVQRFSHSLIKLVPTQWGAPTFEIDGIKMLPTAQLSPFADAQQKVALIQPRGKVILDTCGGLGYFAMWCLRSGASEIVSFEKNSDVLWLRSLNPWSPEGSGETDARLQLTVADVSERIASLPTARFDAALHDPPRFGIAGELYSQAFYDELARVLKPRGKLFHYTGTPNKLTTGRDVPREVAGRLQRAGFDTRLHGDGVLATKNRREVR
ncbi:MAG TPA: MnmC family methyltransferase [Steroidobacteraceae bacterium]|nr:MnmC family methyltransferase [Steroidobacteraceae bacterium]